MPFLTSPLALLALAALPVVVGIYFLRNRYRRQTVSSLFLWESFVRSQEGGTRVTRLQTPLTLLLELLVLLCLVLAAVDPRWRRTAPNYPLAVVLDNSASMQCSRDRALAALRDELRGLDSSSIRFILAGPRPRPLGRAGAGLAEIESQLADWTCLAPDAALDEATALALETGEEGTRVLVITDHAPAAPIDPGAALRWRAVGQPTPNIGIVAAGRRDAGAADRCFVEIRNFSDSEAGATLQIDEANPLRVNLGPGASLLHRFDIPIEQDRTAVRLGDDAMGADNEVHLVAPFRPEVKIQLLCRSGEIQRLVTKALAAAGHRTFGAVDPDLVISDRPVPDLQNDERWVMEILPEAKAQAWSGPFVTDARHPLMRGVDLLGTVWGAASTNRTDLPPIVAVGDTVLLGGQGVRFRMHLQPRFSTLQDTPNWPILFQNLRDACAATRPGPSQSNLRAGTEVTIRADTNLATITVGGLGEIPVVAGRMRLQPEESGVYDVKAGDERYTLAVNLLSPRESDLRLAEDTTQGSWRDTGSIRREYAGTAWFWLLLALAIFAGHLYWTHRRARA